MNSNVDRRLACPRTADFRLPMSLDLCQALAQSPRAVAALAAFRSVTGFNVTLLPTDGRPSLNGSKTSASPLCDLILKTPAGRAACGRVLSGCRVTFKTRILCAIKTRMGQKTGQWSRTMGLALGSGASRR